MWNKIENIFKTREIEDFARCASHSLILKMKSCNLCHKVLPDILNLEEFRKIYPKQLCKDVYSIIENKIVRRNTYMVELETPCNVHFSTRVICQDCLKNGKASFYDSIVPI